MFCNSATFTATAFPSLRATYAPERPHNAAAPPSEWEVKCEKQRCSAPEQPHNAAAPPSEWVLECNRQQLHPLKRGGQGTMLVPAGSGKDTSRKMQCTGMGGSVLNSCCFLCNWDRRETFAAVSAHTEDAIKRLQVWAEAYLPPSSRQHQQGGRLNNQ
jgi:hypothetical protein